MTLPGLVLVSCLTSSISLATNLEAGLMFVKTDNISRTNFALRMTRSFPLLSSHLQCTAQCGFWAAREGNCNSYSYLGLSGRSTMVSINNYQ